MEYQMVDRIRGRKLQELRKRKWLENPRCAKCDRVTAYPSGFELDHKVALSDEGTNDDSNLQVLCHPCHDIKTADDLGYKPRQTIGADGWPVEQTQQSSTARWKRAERG